METYPTYSRIPCDWHQLYKQSQPAARHLFPRARLPCRTLSTAKRAAAFPLAADPCSCSEKQACPKTRAREERIDAGVRPESHALLCILSMRRSNTVHAFIFCLVISKLWNPFQMLVAHLGDLGAAKCQSLLTSTKRCL
jgi:hypothetical protein